MTAAEDAIVMRLEAELAEAKALRELAEEEARMLRVSLNAAFEYVRTIPKHLEQRLFEVTHKAMLKEQEKIDANRIQEEGRDPPRRAQGSSPASGA
jgi:hypothetical protein